MRVERGIFKPNRSYPIDERPMSACPVKLRPKSALCQRISEKKSEQLDSISSNNWPAAAGSSFKYWPQERSGDCHTEHRFYPQVTRQCYQQRSGIYGTEKRRPKDSGSQRPKSAQVTRGTGAAAAAIVAAQHFSSQLTEAKVKIAEFDQMEDEDAVRRAAFFAQLAQEVFAGETLQARIVSELLSAIYPKDEDSDAPIHAHQPYFDQIKSNCVANQQLSDRVDDLLNSNASKMTRIVQLEHELHKAKRSSAAIKLEATKLDAKFRVTRSMYEDVRQDEMLANAQINVYEKLLINRRKLWQEDNKDSQPEASELEHNRIRIEDRKLDEAAERTRGAADDPADNSSVSWQLGMRMLVESFEQRGAMVRATLKDVPSFNGGTIEINDIPDSIKKLGIVIDPNEFVYLAHELDVKGNGRVEVVTLHNVLQSIHNSVTTSS